MIEPLYCSLVIAVLSDFFPIYDLSLPQISVEFVPVQCKESSTFLRYAALFFTRNSSLYSLLFWLYCSFS